MLPIDLTNLIEKIQPQVRTTLKLADELDARGQKTGAPKLVVEHRQLLPEEPREPKREESPKRAHEFLSATSLADYLRKYGTPNTVVFADTEAETIHAVLDETADNGFQAVSMKPALHPLWKPWEHVSGRYHDVKDFGKFVIENRRSIVEPDARGLALDFQQIKASVEITAQAGRGKSSINGLIVVTDVKGDRKGEPIDLPESIKLHLPLYVDTSALDVDLDLCIEANASGQVTVLVTSSAIAEARVAAFNDMVAILRAALAEKGATFTFGRPRHVAWKYLPELAAKA